MAQFARAHVFVYARCLATVVRVDGEIDAANARDLTEAIRGFARLKTPVVLDLSRLRFLSVEGFRALLFVNDELRKARVHCSVVTGTAIRPLLRIVHDNGLATTDSVPEHFKPSKTSLRRDGVSSPNSPARDSRVAGSPAAPRRDHGEG